MSYDILVIGGGPAGLSAALNARARGKSVLVVSNDLEDNPLWKSELVDNYPGLPGVTGAELLKALEDHAARAGAEIRRGKVLNTAYDGESWYVSIGADVEDAKALILAAGIVRGKKFPGEEALLGVGVSYCATCDGGLYRGKDVAVIGYDAESRREADFLEEIGCRVRFFLSPKEVEIQGQGKVSGVTVDGEQLAVDAAFLLRPSMAPTDLFPELETQGSYVKVDRSMATNLPGLFAAGDCTGGPLQVAKATGEGLIAGQKAAAYVDALTRKKG